MKIISLKDYKFSKLSLENKLKCESDLFRLKIDKRLNDLNTKTK